MGFYGALFEGLYGGYIVAGIVDTEFHPLGIESRGSGHGVCGGICQRPLQVTVSDFHVQVNTMGR